MLNVNDTSLNNFEIVPGQDALMVELDQKFPNLKGCLIMVGDQISPMMNPLLYASFLLINRIMEEKKDKATLAAICRTSKGQGEEAEPAEQKA